MGYGHYSVEAHRALTEQRADGALSDVFRETACHPTMNPRGLAMRESRDSAAHPESVAIVFALDVSGSMESIPHGLATKTLPTFFEAVAHVVPHPQLAFLAFGNAYTDRSPLQVGQFESEAGLIDQWLSRIHVEAEGGGWGESYDLAMYVAARHTAIDCLELRGKKGYFFMTGDETPFIEVNPSQVLSLLGTPLQAPIFISDLARELVTRYHAFFLIPDPARAARDVVLPVWRALLRERCLVLATPDDTAVVCAAAIAIEEGAITDVDALRAHLAAQHARTGEESERVIETLRQYLTARVAGTIGAPQDLHRRTDAPTMRG